MIGAGGLSGDTSGTLRNMLGLSDEFYNKVYGKIKGKVVSHSMHAVFQFLCTIFNPQHAFGLVPVLLRPRSRGRLSLKSTNPFHWPRMEPNFYTDQNDLKTLIQGIRWV